MPIPRQFRSTGLEDFFDHVLRRPVAVAGDHPGVSILDCGAAVFKLFNGFLNAQHQIERFKTGDDDGDAVLAGDRLVFPIAHHRAYMARCQKALHAVLR